MKETAVRNWDGWVLGYIKTLPSGNMVATDPTGKIVGRYNPNLNITTDPVGVKLYDGNMLNATIPPDSRKR